MEYRHIPVMLDEVIEYLRLKNGDNVVDCTLGGAGYTLAILKQIMPDGKVFSFDMDPLAIENAKKIIEFQNLKNIVLINDNFKNLHKNIQENIDEKGFGGISAFVFDLGLSSAQLEDRLRGFSFQLDAPLEMSFGSNDGFSDSTLRIINQYPQAEIVRILKEYGEERYALGISRGIATARKDREIKTTRQLVEIVAASVPGSYRKNKKIHFATKTFQALRIATNGELENLREALPQALDMLNQGGRIVVVSYHSLEDRIVKQFFKNESRDCLCPKELPVCRCGHKAKINIITKRILIPTEEEIIRNPRSRSAKMRVAEKI